MGVAQLLVMRSVMKNYRPWNRSVRALAIAAALTCGPSLSQAQDAGVQKLFETGQLEQVVERSAEGDPATAFLAAQALIKMEQPDRAREQFARIESSDDEVWKLVGRSGTQLLGGDAEGALATAREAAEKDGSRALAHYQLGLAASRKGDYRTASSAFTRASELHPDFAYAYYYGGLAHQRNREIAKAAEALKTFLSLAPEAPERGAVQAILRTLR